MLTVAPLSASKQRQTRYYLYDKVDWAYINRCLAPTFPPILDMMLYFNDEINEDATSCTPARTVLSINQKEKSESL